MQSLACARIAYSITALLALTACGEKVTSAPPLPGHGLASLVVQSVMVPTERAVDGTVEAVNHATVAAQTGGQVTRILYDVNDVVPAGAVIMRIRSTEQRAGARSAEAALTEAQARNEEAIANYQRAAGMYQQRLVSKADFDQTTANRDAAAARLAAAQAGVITANEGVGYTEVRAPYGGVVSKRLVEVGEMVTPGTPLMSGLSLRELRVTTNVPQSVVMQVRHLKKAAIYLGDQRIEATRITLFPEAATPSSTFRARLELPSGAFDLAPGMYVKVGLVTGAAAQITVPHSAVVAHSEITGVHVIDAQGRVALRYLRLGKRVGEDVEVLSGLAAGEIIATDPIAASAAAAGAKR